MRISDWSSDVCSSDLTALGLFNLGPPIGQALGVAFGAMIAAAYDWRLAFLLLGGAGLVAAAAVWGLVREPKRGATDAPVRPAVTAHPAGEVVSFGKIGTASCRERVCQYG